MYTFHSIIHCETCLISYLALDDFPLAYHDQITLTFEPSDSEAHTSSCCHQSGFPRMMESSTMLQKVLCLVRHPSNVVGTLDPVEQLDLELRDSLDKALTVTVGEGLRNVGAVSILIRSVLSTCTAIIASPDWTLHERFRALFLLHEMTPTHLVEANEKYRAKRAATLDCISRMMVEAARTNIQGSDPIRLDRHPGTGIYNVQAAIRHLSQKMLSYESGESELMAVRDLYAMDNLYTAYWGIPRASL